jgi:hypothetical protein
VFIHGLQGSEEQKQELLPAMAAFDKVGCWALTEPSNGSDASALTCTATKVQTKRLIITCLLLLLMMMIPAEPCLGISFPIINVTPRTADSSGWASFHVWQL